jgi:hypothetical protein
VISTLAQHSQFLRLDHLLAAVGDVESSVDVFKVRLYRGQGDGKPLGSLFLVQALRRQLKHIDFAVRQRARSAAPSACVPVGQPKSHHILLQFHYLLLPKLAGTSRNYMELRGDGPSCNFPSCYGLFHIVPCCSDPVVELITQRSLVQIQPPLPSKLSSRTQDYSAYHRPRGVQRRRRAATSPNVRNERRC